MLTKIWKVCKAIGEFISAVCGFIKDMVLSIIEFFKLIPKAVDYLTSCFSWLPASILAIVVVIITVLVVKKVVNR